MDTEKYIALFKKYCQFKGRASRSEYWYFVLFNIVVSIALGVVDGILGVNIFGMIFSLVMLVPGLATSVRRLHDTGRDWPWLLIALIPVVGALVLLFFMIQDSEAGSNKYGPSPKK